MDVPDLGGSGLSLTTLLLILGIVLVGLPLAASAKEALEQSAQRERARKQSGFQGY